jgi:hypothetical protein
MMHACCSNIPLLQPKYCFVACFRKQDQLEIMVHIIARGVKRLVAEQLQLSCSVAAAQQISTCSLRQVREVRLLVWCWSNEEPYVCARVMVGPSPYHKPHFLDK